jgi:uncharacterized protein (DUF924 family)
MTLWPAGAPIRSPMTEHPTPQDVLDFWFKETLPAAWWSVDPVFDAQVRSRFLPLLRQAAQGECVAWRGEPTGRLAEIVVLDQFSRNIHRGTAQAFAQDPMALALAQEAVAQGALAHLSPVERSFLLLPYMHSESRLVHQHAEALYRAHAPAENLDFELKHKAIIDRFGRYPHRNEVLGRASTAQELAFLTQPGSRF